MSELQQYHNDAKVAYSAVLESAAATAKGWRTATLIACGVALAAVVGVGYIGAQSKIHPVLVVMKDDFVPVGIFSPSGAVAPTDERVVSATLAQIVNDLRSITSDQSLQRKRFNNLALFIKSGSTAFRKIQAMLSDPKTNPIELSAFGTVDVVISNVLKITPSTWQVDWVERAWNNSSDYRPPPVQFRGNFVFVHRQVSGDGVLVNPTGLLLVDYNLAEVDK